MVWYSHLFQNFPQFVVIHTVKGFDIVNKAEVDLLWNSLAFSVIELAHFSSVTQSCLTLCDPMNHSTPGLPVHHQLPEFTQHMSNKSVMPSKHLILCCLLLLLPPIPPSKSFQMSQLYTSGGQSIGVSASTSVLPMKTQAWSLGWTGWISLQSKGLSRVFSNTTVQSTNSSALSFLYSSTLTFIHDHWKNHSLG